MRFYKRFWEPIARGEITVAFRRWQRPLVVAGRRYRTAGTILEVDHVGQVDPEQVTDEEARAAGHSDAASLLTDFGDRNGFPLYRIRFHLAEGPDPRAELAADAVLSAEDLAEIDLRLDRLDRASSHGAWTREVLLLIEANPGRRAPDLAEIRAMETIPFKVDVRKLKNLGLTESLQIGYQLSPRGIAYLASRFR